MTPKNGRARSAVALADPTEDRVFDFTARRKARAAARAEAEAAPPIIRIDGVEYELPVELPLAVIEDLGALQAGDLSALRRSLSSLSGAAWARLENETLSIDDALDLLTGVVSAYGVENVGELLASRLS